MSDSEQSTFSTHPEPTLFRDSQRRLRELLAALRHVEQGLAELIARLPEPAFAFNATAELRLGAHCVRNDLLLDAVETLEFVANLPEEKLQKRFEERLTWLPVVM